MEYNWEDQFKSPALRLPPSRSLGSSKCLTKMSYGSFSSSNPIGPLRALEHWAITLSFSIASARDMPSNRVIELLRSLIIIGRFFTQIRDLSEIGSNWSEASCERNNLSCKVLLYLSTIPTVRLDLAFWNLVPCSLSNLSQSPLNSEPLSVINNAGQVRDTQDHHRLSLKL